MKLKKPVLKNSDFKLKKHMENPIQKAVRTDLINPNKSCVPYQVS